MTMPATKKQPDVRLHKLLYRRDEASYVLGVSVREVDRMIADKRLTTRRYGKCVLIPAGDITRLADTILNSDMLQGAASGRQ